MTPGAKVAREIQIDVVAQPGNSAKRAATTLLRAAPRDERGLQAGLEDDPRVVLGA